MAPTRCSSRHRAPQNCTPRGHEPGSTVYLSCHFRLLSQPLTSGAGRAAVWDEHPLSHTGNVAISFQPESQLLWVEEKVEGSREFPLPRATGLPPKSPEANSFGMTSGT